jgi:phosphatidylcholine synthase
VILPWAAHLYTALGAGTALAATLAIIDGDYRGAFLWLLAAVVIDATDGALARALKVKERLPWFDGGLLDNIVDYLTYVFVPVLLMLQAGLLPPGAAGLAVGVLVLLASAYGFTQAEAKVATTDHFFTGWPSYWNIVALYLYLWGLPTAVNAAILVLLAVLVFVPLRYVYPSRTVTLRVPTLVLGTAWGILVLLVVWRLPATDGPWFALSHVSPSYYYALSFWLHGRDRGAGPAA